MVCVEAGVNVDGQVMAEKVSQVERKMSGGMRDLGERGMEPQRSSEARWFTMNRVPLAGEAKLTGLPLLLLK